MTKKLNKKEYLKNPTCCPYCKKYSVSWNKDKIVTKKNSKTLESYHSCSFCNNTFVDIYKLVDVRKGI